MRHRDPYTRCLFVRLPEIWIWSDYGKEPDDLRLPLVDALGAYHGPLSPRRRQVQVLISDLDDTFLGTPALSLPGGWWCSIKRLAAVLFRDFLGSW